MYRNLFDSSNPVSAKEMRDWNLEFAKNLLTMNGRRLPTEKIFQSRPEMAVRYCSRSVVIIEVFCVCNVYINI